MATKKQTLEEKAKDELEKMPTLNEETAANEKVKFADLLNELVIRKRKFFFCFEEIELKDPQGNVAGTELLPVIYYKGHSKPRETGTYIKTIFGLPSWERIHVICETEPYDKFKSMLDELWLD